MKTMILATAAVLGIGIGSAYAGEGDGPIANTLFTELPGVIAQPQVQVAPSAVAANQNGARTNVYVSHSATGTWLFPPYQLGGGNQ